MANQLNLAICNILTEFYMNVKCFKGIFYVLDKIYKIKHNIKYF